MAMGKNISGIGAIALAIAVLTAVYFIVSLPRESRFNVKNFDSEPVRVSARWRDQIKDIGIIDPGKNVEFSISGAAAISFRIERANGTFVETGSTSFTAGTEIEVNIARTSVAVNYTGPK